MAAVRFFLIILDGGYNEKAATLWECYDSEAAGEATGGETSVA